MNIINIINNATVPIFGSTVTTDVITCFNASTLGKTRNILKARSALNVPVLKIHETTTKIKSNVIHPFWKIFTGPKW